MKDPQKQLDKFAQNKDIQKELDYFEKNISKFDSVESLLKDRRMARVLLSAYDLQDEQAMGMGRIKKVLTEDPTSSNALSAKLADSRFAAMAKDLRLDKGLDGLKTSAFMSKLEGKYIQSEFEQALGRQDPALRQAAYFARNASSKTTNIYSILGDKIVRDVVTSTLNIPAQLAIQPIETQARAITARLDISKFAEALSQAGGLNSNEIKRGKEDLAAVEGNLKISDAAYNQVKSIQSKIDQAISDYTAFSNKTTAPAELAAQQEAIPELLRFEQMLNSGAGTLSNVGTNIANLQKILTDASNPANAANLASYKERFTNLVNTITSQIGSANVTTPTTYDEATDGGTPPTENIFQFGSNGTLTAQLKSDGTKNVDINVYNANDLLASLQNAKAAFDAASSSSDLANLSTANNQVSNALTRTNSMKSSIAADTATLKDKLDDVQYGVTLNSDDLLRGKLSIDDALSRTKTISSLLEQISSVAAESAARNTNADRTDLTTKFNGLRTQLYNAINNTTTPGLDNLLTKTGRAEYDLMTRPDGNGGSEDLHMYSNGVGSTIQDIVTALDAASIGDKAGAGALELKALQLTNRTDLANRSLNADKPAFDRVVSNYDPKAKIDLTFYDLRRDLDNLVNSAAVDGVNLLSADQTDISFTVSSSSDVLRLRAAKTFKSDVATQLQNVINQMANGLAATKTAAQGLSSVVDRTYRFLGSDNRSLSFEQGRIGVILDVADPQTGEDGTSSYKVNSYTEKFITRYLTMNGSNGMSFTSSQAANLSLFSGTSDVSSLTSSILSLSMSI